MAKPNYSFEKRQRELAKKKKKEEKAKDKAGRKAGGEPGQDDAQDSGDSTERAEPTDGGDASVAPPPATA